MDEELLQRQQPQSLEAEQAVLGSILIDSRCITDVVGVVKPEDFYLKQNREIFETIYTMFNYSQTIDPVTVLDKMKELGHYQDNSRDYILQLMEITPTAANVIRYARIVREKSMLRGLANAADDISEMMALYAARHIWDVLFCGLDGEGQRDAGGFTPVQRHRLSLAACAAGIAINKTGTGFPHPLGYSITLSEGIPHGRACGAFAGAYIEYNMRTAQGEARLTRFAAYLGSTPAEMARRIPLKADVHLTLTRDEIDEHIDRVAGAGNYANSPYVISRDEMTMIYSSLFGVK